MIADLDPSLIGAIAVAVLLGMIAAGLPAALSMITVAALGLVALNDFDIARRFAANAFTMVTAWLFFGIAALIFINHALYRAWQYGGAGERRPPGALSSLIVLATGAAGTSGLGLPDGTARATVARLVSRGTAPAAAVLAVRGAAALGMVMPTSVALFAVGLVMEVSIGRLMLAVLVPWVIILIGVFVALLVSHRSDQPEPTHATGAIVTVVALICIGLMLDLIVVGVATPTEAAVLIVVPALLVFLALHRPIGIGLLDLFSGAAACAADTMFRLIAASTFALFLGLSGALQSLLDGAVSSGLAPVALLAGLVGAAFLIGLIIDGLSTLLIVGPLGAGLGSISGTDPIVVAALLLVGIAAAQAAPSILGLPAFVRDRTGSGAAVTGAIVILVSVLVALGAVTVLPPIELY